MAKPAIALYLGETYATIGLFDISDKQAPLLQFEKSVFLPQISLKNLLQQTKLKLQEYFSESDNPIKVYVVTKYFDRLKQFRLGGSISQVILKGFENSYTLKDSKALSLAASQLIISLEPESIETEVLTQELERIKKINPDLNKVVISLPEDHFTSQQIETVNQFFLNAGLKIFNCTQPYNQNELRKTLLNAGSEGTKEEMVTDLKENLGENSEIYFFCHNGFRKESENCELFNSANNFFAHYLKTHKLNTCAYFDIESFRFLRIHFNETWESPWGSIPVKYYSQTDLNIHPFSEIKLNQLSMLNFEGTAVQLEPGPVVAGRAIKPLVLDLFLKELQENSLSKSIFTQIDQENLKTKIQNLFTVLEKGQKNNLLFTSISEMKQIIIETLHNEIKLLSGNENGGTIGPLSSIFSSSEKSNLTPAFSWPREIISLANNEAKL